MHTNKGYIVPVILILLLLLLAGGFIFFQGTRVGEEPIPVSDPFQKATTTDDLPKVDENTSTTTATTTTTSSTSVDVQVELQDEE